MEYTVITYELINNQWSKVLSHTFFGNNPDEINALIQAHMRTDSFFAGSFKGNWNGITLKNEYK